MITQDILSSYLVSPSAGPDRVKAALQRTKESDFGLLRFMRKYAKWNSYFAGGVCQLVANIAQAGELFMEPGLPRSLADRSQLISSYIFDAARDEFDDHINRQRDPHRSLAQGMLQGMANYYGNLVTELGPLAFDVLDEEEGDMLLALCNQVKAHYDGQSVDIMSSLSPGVEKIFHGMGYHLGSEFLADQEFSIIDQFMRTEQKPTTDYLLHHQVHLANADHRCYAWIGVHSGHDGGAEADHFAWALEGVNLALEYGVNAETHAFDQVACMQYLRKGFKDFEKHHMEFFNIIVA